MKIPTIETPRLYLRGFQKEDARFAAGIWNDAEMGEYLPDEAMENWMRSICISWSSWERTRNVAT